MGLSKYLAANKNKNKILLKLLFIQAPKGGTVSFSKLKIK